MTDAVVERTGRPQRCVVPDFDFDSKVARACPEPAFFPLFSEKLN